MSIDKIIEPKILCGICRMEIRPGEPTEPSIEPPCHLASPICIAALMVEVERFKNVSYKSYLQWERMERQRDTYKAMLEDLVDTIHEDEGKIRLTEGLDKAIELAKEDLTHRKHL